MKVSGKTKVKRSWIQFPSRLKILPASAGMGGWPWSGGVEVKLGWKPNSRKAQTTKR